MEDSAGDVVRLLATSEPRCGSVKVLAIDGPSGSGKTTLAAAVARRLATPAVTIVHMDDLFPGWDGLARAVDLLVDQVLRPLSQGQQAGFRRWDWDAAAWGDRVELRVEPGGVLIVEGCASSVRPAGDYAAAAVWVEADEDVRFARGIDRDGDAFAPHWRAWQAQERALFAADATRDRADLIITT